MSLYNAPAHCRYNEMLYKMVDVEEPFLEAKPNTIDKARERGRAALVP